MSMENMDTDVRGGRLQVKEKFKEEKDCHTPQVSHTLMYSDLFTYKTRMHYKYVCSSSITIQFLSILHF